MTGHCRVVVTLLSIALASVLNIQAQKNEQRIFLWDVSESLNSNGMWSPQQDALIKAVESIPSDPSNRIVLVPFYHDVLETISVPASDDGKNKIIKAIKARGKKAKPYGNRKTNLVAAIKKYHSLTSKKYKNYMFLFTDGENEIGDLSKELNEWTANNNGLQSYGFYVLVHKNADKPEIRKAENEQHNFWVVPNADITIKTASITPQTTINIRDTHKAYISAKELSKFDSSPIFSVTDPLFDVNLDFNQEKGLITATITPKQGKTIPENHVINIGATTDGKNAFEFIVPETFQIKCINKPERTLKIEFK